MYRLAATESGNLSEKKTHIDRPSPCSAFISAIVGLDVGSVLRLEQTVQHTRRSGQTGCANQDKYLGSFEKESCAIHILGTNATLILDEIGELEGRELGRRSRPLT